MEFGADFLGRLGVFTARVEALRLRREGPGRSFLGQAGEEWIGSRPYRAGDDVRDIDWNLLARHDQPYVQVRRREAAERWEVWLDTSASMGLGRPGKLQAAAECALGIAALGLARGAQVVLEFGDQRLALRGTADLGAGIERLGELQAAGVSNLGARVRGGGGPGGSAGRRVLLGDLLDVRPAQLAAGRRPGVEWIWGQFLCARELELGSDGDAGAQVRYRDPEQPGGARAQVLLDPGTRAAYQRALSDRLEEFGRVAALHRVRYGCFETQWPFEQVLQQLLVG